MAGQTQFKEKTAAMLLEPMMYAVILHNDDITTMDFVVDLLEKVFGKSSAESAKIMMDVHYTGEGIAGVYTYDLAVTKKMQADRLSREKHFPLRLTLEEYSDWGRIG